MTPVECPSSYGKSKHGEQIANKALDFYRFLATVDTMELKRKVLAYITKEEEDGREILVFEQKDNPDAGLQVPGGTIEEDELLIDALYREIEEETGIPREGSRVERQSE